MTDATPESDSPPPARRKSRRPLAFALAGVVLGALVVVAGSWLSSESALVTLIDWVVARSDGKLEVERPRGSLFGHVEIARIVYRDAGTTVVAEDVAIDHAPRALLGRALAITALTVGRIAIDVPRSDGEPVSMPDTLAIPYDVTIDRATIRRLEWRSGDSSGTLEDIGLRYAGGRRVHRIDDFVVRGAGGRLAGAGSVGTSKPFATRAELTLDLVRPNPEGRVQGRLDGDLETLSLVAKATIEGVTADVQGKLAPFARQPIVEGKVDARGVDLARLDARWPTTSLAVVIEARPSPGGFSGTAHAVNAAHGPIDANRVPIAELRGAFTLSGAKLQLRDLVAQAGGGSVAGSGSIDVETLENRWKLVVDRLDLKRLHGSLIETRLAGRIDADVDQNVQRVVADVAQKDVQLAFDATYDGRTLVAKRLLAQAFGGSVEGSGRIALAGNRPFAVDVRARRFNPARFGDFPSGALDGTIVATGTASPDIAVDADIAIAPGSRIAGLATQGSIKGNYAGATVKGLVADVTLGANRLQARGAHGRPGDRLTLVLAAKRLAELDPLLPPAIPKPLTGSIEGTATLDTLARGARLEVDARARNLGAGSAWQVATLAVEGRATHAAPLGQPRIDAVQEIALTAAATGVSTPEGHADRLRVSLSGSAASHTLSFAGNEREFAIEGRATAALAGSGATTTWRGRMESLAVRGLPGIAELALSTPAAFQLGSRRVVVDDFRIVGNGATLDVETFSIVGDAIASRGRFRGLPVAPLIKYAGLAERFPTDITVGGAWDVSSQGGWRGTLRVARERGDVYIDEPADERATRIALGVETLALDATLEGNRLNGKAELRARLGGTALAEFEVRAPQGSPHPFVASAPVSATIKANLQSLASLQPWIGTSARVQGQAIADVTVSGTLGKPSVTGQLAGQGLRVDMPAYGVSFKDGQVRIASGPEGLKLEELSFTGGDGRFVASGVIGLPGERGAPGAPSRIQWRAENFRVLNRPDLRMIVDGEGTLALEQKRIVVRGKVSVDEGTIDYRSSADTTLADDIVVIGRPRRATARPDAIVADAPLDLDLEITLGRDLRFSGAGLEARLAGRVQVTAKAGAPIAAKGVIRTVRGTYSAFGQKLTIERGRILFDGPIANPALDIVALRKNLAVEAGVEIFGTARAPLVRLTSEPPVPDNEKLAWLLTGGPAGSGTARDSAALSAAAALLSGGDGKPLTQRIAQRMGLDEIAVTQRESADNDPASSGQVVTLGKRISDRLYVAYEQGITLASNALRIEYVISRYLTVAAFAGTSSGIALNFRRNWP